MVQARIILVISYQNLRNALYRVSDSKPTILPIHHGVGLFKFVQGIDNIFAKLCVI